ncbi:hypothetical protein FRB99_002209, partial [Tulasnella sp. 403]
MSSLPREYYVRGKINISDDEDPAGCGGFGNVYVGTHPTHGRVALKHVSIATSAREARNPTVQEQTRK